MDKDAYYFPHFCNARNDRKLRRVRKELGVEGYGIYFMILEVLREQKDFKYPMDDIDLLADEFRTSDQKVRVVICNYDLFQVDENEQFFSPKFIEYLSPYLERKQRNRINGIKGNLIKYNYATKAELSAMSDDEILHLSHSVSVLSGGESGGESLSDRNKSKVKESKSKKTKLPIYNQKIVDVVDMVSEITDKNILLAIHIWNDVDSLQPNNKTTQKAKVKTWAEPIRLMVEQDNRTYEEIWKLWKRVHADSFWQSNVLSTSKLRDKYDELSIKFKPNGGINESFIDSLYE